MTDLYLLDCIWIWYQQHSVSLNYSLLFHKYSVVVHLTAFATLIDTPQKVVTFCDSWDQELLCHHSSWVFFSFELSIYVSELLFCSLCLLIYYFNSNSLAFFRDFFLAEGDSRFFFVAWYSLFYMLVRLGPVPNFSDPFFLFTSSPQGTTRQSDTCTKAFKLCHVLKKKKKNQKENTETPRIQSIWGKVGI